MGRKVEMREFCNGEILELSLVESSVIKVALRLLARIV